MKIVKFLLLTYISTVDIYLCNTLIYYKLVHLIIDASLEVKKAIWEFRQIIRARSVNSGSSLCLPTGLAGSIGLTKSWLIVSPLIDAVPGAARGGGATAVVDFGKKLWIVPFLMVVLVNIFEFYFLAPPHTPPPHPTRNFGQKIVCFTRENSKISLINLYLYCRYLSM